MKAVEKTKEQIQIAGEDEIPPEPPRDRRQIVRMYPHPPSLPCLRTTCLSVRPSGVVSVT